VEQVEHLLLLLLEQPLLHNRMEEILLQMVLQETQIVLAVDLVAVAVVVLHVLCILNTQINILYLTTQAQAAQAAQVTLLERSMLQD
jgi:hypothetical protein